MFFYLAKMLWFAAQPSSLLLLLTLAGAGLLWTRYARAARRIVLAAALLFAVCGLSPLGNAVLLPLEERFPPADLEKGPAPAGIIVLGGAQDMLVSAARGQPALTEAGERFVEVVVLARRFPNARIVVSGGSSHLIYRRVNEARGAADILVRLGVDRSRIVLEDRARDTYENAVFTRAVVQPRPGERWLLVTSANHMPRAIGCFRRAGFAVEAWPVDFRTRGRADLTRFFDKPSAGLRRLDIAARQWAGLLAYRLAGRTDALFPAP